MSFPRPNRITPSEKKKRDAQLNPSLRCKTCTHRGVFHSAANAGECTHGMCTCEGFVTGIPAEEHVTDPPSGLPGVPPDPRAGVLRGVLGPGADIQSVLNRMDELDPLRRAGALDDRMEAFLGEVRNHATLTRSEEGFFEPPGVVLLTQLLGLVAHGIKSAPWTMVHDSLVSMASYTMRLTLEGDQNYATPRMRRGLDTPTMYRAEPNAG